MGCRQSPWGLEGREALVPSPQLCPAPGLNLLLFFGPGVSVRPGAEGEGAGAALTNSRGRQQEPELHGQILGAAGDVEREAGMEAVESSPPQVGLYLGPDAVEGVCPSLPPPATQQATLPGPSQSDGDRKHGSLV